MSPPIDAVKRFTVLKLAGKRLLLDSNVIDWIADTPGVRDRLMAALVRGQFSLIDMYVIRNQLAATPDPERKALLLATYDSLPKEKVASHGFVLGMSVLGEATLGHGSESGVALGDVKTSGQGGMADALLATTASGRADVLVTEDSGLRGKVLASTARCAVWTINELDAQLGRD